MRWVGLTFAVVLAGVLAVIAVALIDNDEEQREVERPEIRSVVEGIPQDGIRLGRPGAPVTVTAFGDLLAPRYDRVINDALVPLIRGPVREGEVRLAYRNWDELAVQSNLAADAALAASRQGRYWEYLLALARTLPGRDLEFARLEDALANIARELGLDLERWRAHSRLDDWDERLRENARRADRLGFDAPPAFVVEGPGGRRLLEDPGRLGEAVDAVAAGGDGGASGGQADGTRIVVEVRREGPDGPVDRRVIECGMGSGPEPCARIRELDPADLEPTAEPRVCTQIYGGPATAQVKGRIRGEQVSASFDLRNGCQIARWERFSWLLGQPPPG